MLTSCPKCFHVFHTTTTSNSSNNLQHEHHRLLLQPPQQFTALPSSSVHFTAPCCESNRQQPPLLVSLQLPPTNVSTTCTVAVSTTDGCEQPISQRVLAGMAGGGIVQNTVADNPSVILQQTTQDEKLVFPPCSPQPSPSAPLSFLLPSAPNVFTTTRTSTLLPLQWTVTTAAVSPTVTTSAVQTPQQWTLPTPTAHPWLLGFQMPPAQQIPQVGLSDTDLVRLTETSRALRTSGWYYEGLSWQESAETLQSTSPGTFLVRDSSDPRFIYSLSVQTDRGPTSVRLHYVCGQFRLDAEPRLVPLMPLFECVVRLVEYYIDATKDTVQASGGEEEDTKRSKDNHLKHKGQVWVDARGRMYSHILLRAPLYKKQHLPSLQHLARLAINRSLKAASAQQFCRNPCSAVLPTSQLPLPTPLLRYLKEYPYSY